MSEEGVTYSVLQWQNSSLLYRRQMHENSNRSQSCIELRDPHGSVSSWKLVVVILGSSCLILLLTLGLLVMKLNEKSSPSQGYPRIIQENKTAVCNSTCPLNWDQHEGMCYYFSEYMVPLEQCEKYCISLFSRFPYVTTEGEMNFLMNMSKLYFRKQKLKYFVSLHYDNVSRKWFWRDGTNYIPPESKISEHVNHKTCGSITNGLISIDDCQSKGGCICKRSLYCPRQNSK